MGLKRIRKIICLISYDVNVSQVFFSTLFVIFQLKCFNGHEKSGKVFIVFH